jgi:ADP-ribose pyrophosphatase YjhB (NUDIX family)
MSTARFKLLSAVCLIVRRNDQMLLLRRANTGYQDGNYGLIAGHLDGNELATQAVAREAREEAGIIVRVSDLRLVHTVHRLDTGISPERIELYFETTVWQGEPANTEPEKCSEVSWHSITALPPDIIPLVRQVLRHVAAAEPYSEYQEELR